MKTKYQVYSCVQSIQRAFLQMASENCDPRSMSSRWYGVCCSTSPSNLQSYRGQKLVLCTQGFVQIHMAYYCLLMLSYFIRSFLGLMNRFSLLQVCFFHDTLHLEQLTNTYVPSCFMCVL